MKVAITGVGGGVGQSIIKSLKDTRHHLVGIDGEVLATGLYCVPSGYVGVYADNSHFISRIKEICQIENCQVLFPGLDKELPYLAAEKNKLEKNGELKVVVSSPEVIEIADDKLQTFNFLEKNGFPALETYNLIDFNGEIDFPVVIKPRKGGARSIGKYVVKDSLQLEEIQQKVESDNYVVQSYARGDEYTCGSVSFEEGCIGTIIMKRQLRCGDTYKAFVQKDEKLDEFLKEVIDTLRPFGPCNVQLRMEDGVPYIFEFNARCSGTTASRSLAGFNEPLMVCDYLDGLKPTFDINKVVIFRYWDEIVVDYDKIEKMSLNKKNVLE